MDDNGIFTIPDGTVQCEEYILSNNSVDNDTVLGIIFPSSVLYIDLEAFFACGNLRRVDMSGANVTTIGIQAFAGCASLISAIIPASVTSIKRGAFSGCTSLKGLTLPNISTIEESVFERCKSFTSLFIPDGVTKIESNAFSECSSLKIMNIPDTVNKIEINAFLKCTSLTTVIIRPGKSLFSFSSAAFRSASVLAAQAAAAASVAVVSAAAAASAPVAAEEAAAAAVAAAKAAVSAFAHAAAFASVAATTADGGDGDDAAAPMDVWGTVFELPPPHPGYQYMYTYRGQASVPFQYVTKIWATDAIVNKLTGPFKGCTCLADVPRAMRVAPDATTWAAAELWLWWSPPTAAGYADKTRTVCTSRQRALFTTMLSAYRTSRSPLVAGAGAGAQMLFCSELMRQLQGKEHACYTRPFEAPFDWRGLGLHAYLEDVKTPMDFGTVRDNVEQHKYGGKDQFISDMRLIWTNCYEYFGKESDHGKVAMALNFERVFEGMLTAAAKSAVDLCEADIQVAPEHQLPALPQELWVVIFGFVKHDQVPV